MYGMNTCPIKKLNQHSLKISYMCILLYIALFSPSPFGRAAPSAFIVSLTLMWEEYQLMWSQAPPKTTPTRSAVIFAWGEPCYIHVVVFFIFITCNFRGGWGEIPNSSVPSQTLWFIIVHRSLHP